MSLTDDFLQSQIDAAKESLAAAITAEASIITGQIESYTMDTGQSRTVVNKLNISSLRVHIDSLLNRISILDSRLTGSGTIIARPGW